MKLFSVIGLSKSGKTTTIENIIGELKKRGYSVGSVKEIHYENFAMDEEGTNTYRHRKAGAEPVTARGYYETDILFRKKLDVNEILKFYSNDYVVMEGVVDYNCPIILCANSFKEIEKIRKEEYFKRIFLISGIISGKTNRKTNAYKGIPVINSMNNTGEFVDFIEKKIYRILPDFPPGCCSRCGYSCRELGVRILKGMAKAEDCVLSKSVVKLSVNGKDVAMVPFVQQILRDCIKAVVKNLKGCREAKNIKITIDDG